MPEYAGWYVMIVLLLLMNCSESQAQEPRWYPAGMQIIPDGRAGQMETKNQHWDLDSRKEVTYSK